MALFNDHLTLISEKITPDNIGNQNPIEKMTTIYCDVQSIGRNEFYGASQAGLKPELTFVIHAYEYSGQRLVKFRGQKYKVIRTYSPNFEELELICEKVTGHAN